MNKTLRHYGIQGMKWGVRKNNTPTAEKTKRIIKKIGSIKLSKIEKSKILQGSYFMYQYLK